LQLPFFFETNKMLLLLVSFSISLSFFFLVQTWKQVVESAEKIKLAKPALAISECRLEAINLEIHKLSWIPVLIRVYLVGMFETFYIALCKRDFSKGSSAFSTATKHINEMIQSYTASSELAVVTGGDSGIGYEICKSLLEAGFRVIIGNQLIKMHCMEYALEIDMGCRSAIYGS
jgi:hypothetical protein